MASYGYYGRGPWVVIYPDQENRFETEEEAREWAKEHGGEVAHDPRGEKDDIHRSAAARATDRR